MLTRRKERRAREGFIFLWVVPECFFDIWRLIGISKSFRKRHASPFLGRFCGKGALRFLSEIVLMTTHLREELEAGLQINAKTGGKSHACLRDRIPMQAAYAVSQDTPLPDCQYGHAADINFRVSHFATHSAKDRTSEKISPFPTSKRSLCRA